MGALNRIPRLPRFQSAGLPSALPTRPPMVCRAWRALRDAYLRFELRWAEQELEWLAQDVAQARHWAKVGPSVLAHRRALIEAQRVQLISGAEKKPYGGA